MVIHSFTHDFVTCFMRKALDQAPEDVAMSQKCLPLFPVRLAGSGETKESKQIRHYM